MPLVQADISSCSFTLTGSMHIIIISLFMIKLSFFWSDWKMVHVRLYKRHIMMLDHVVSQTGIRDKITNLQPLIKEIRRQHINIFSSSCAHCNLISAEGNQPSRLPKHFVENSRVSTICQSNDL